MIQYQTKEHEIQSFIVHGGWSNDSHFGACTTTCGNGKQYEMKQCDNPKPLNGGKNCSCNSKNLNEVECDGVTAKIQQACTNAPCPGTYFNYQFLIHLYTTYIKLINI